MKAPTLDYLTSSGERAATILPLTWFTLIVSIAVSGERVPDRSMALR